MSFHSYFEERIDRHPGTRTIVPVFDMHLHFVDFLQNTDGFDALFDSMDKGNIAKNVVFGLPVKKKWEFFEPKKPTYYLGDNSKCIHYASSDEMVAFNYVKLAEDKRKRIAPTLCGFDPTDLCAIDYIEFMFEKYPIWKGIGEVLLRHDDLTNLTLGETARANHPALGPVYEFCAKKKIPVCLHQNSTSVGVHDEYEYLHEIKKRVEKYDTTTFIWAHCGVSRRVTHKDYHVMVKNMLKDHPNLHVDLSWVVYEDVICEPRKNDTDPLIPKKVWLDQVICRFPDRIMIGSDLCGHFEKHGQTMARYNGLLEVLPEETRNKIARGNAEKLYFPAE